MIEISLDALEPRLREQLDLANRAIQRDVPIHAIDIARSILSRYPGCLAVRKILREAQQAAFGQRPGYVSLMTRLRARYWIALGRILLQRSPERAIVLAERAVAICLWSNEAHALLAHAASRCGFYETALFAWESAVALDPANAAHQISLSKIALRLDRPERALRAVEVALRHEPGNREASMLLKRASVDYTLADGEWVR